MYWFTHLITFIDLRRTHCRRKVWIIGKRFLISRREYFNRFTIDFLEWWLRTEIEVERNGKINWKVSKDAIS